MQPFTEKMAWVIGIIAYLIWLTIIPMLAIGTSLSLILAIIPVVISIVYGIRRLLIWGSTPEPEED